MKDERDIAQLCARGGASGRARSARVPNASAAMLPRFDGFTETAISLHALALLALVSTTVFTGCSREPAAAPAESAKPAYSRVEDPEYKKEIDSLRKAQAEISARAGEIARELEAARAADPNGARTKQLEKKQAAVTAELEKNRALSMAAIRRWKNKEEQANAKAND